MVVGAASNNSAPGCWWQRQHVARLALPSTTIMLDIFLANPWLDSGKIWKSHPN